MKVDLAAEMFAATARIRGCHLDRMEALGVPKWAMARLGQRQPPFGLARTEPTSGGLYEPAEDGPFSVIVPVMEISVIDVGIPVETAEIIDLIAFRSTAPMRWTWRTGDGWALGAHLLAEDAPLDVVATPLEWLAEAGRALCILDWTLPPRAWHRLRRGSPLVAGNEMLRRRLNSAFAACIPPLVLQPAKPRKAGRHAA